MSKEKILFNTPEDINLKLRFIFQKTWGKTYEAYLLEVKRKKKEKKLKKEVE
jgi:hypothetical protein